MTVSPEKSPTDELDTLIEDAVIGGTDDYPVINRALLLGDLTELLSTLRSQNASLTAETSIQKRLTDALQRAAPIVAFHAGVADKGVSSLTALNIHNDLQAALAEAGGNDGQ